MCDVGIDPMQLEAMRQAYGELRAAALRLLACCETIGPAAASLEQLRAACVPDPASFAVEPPRMHRMTLRLPASVSGGGRPVVRSPG